MTRQVTLFAILSVSAISIESACDDTGVPAVSPDPIGTPEDGTVYFVRKDADDGSDLADAGSQNDCDSSDEGGGDPSEGEGEEEPDGGTDDSDDDEDDDSDDDGSDDEHHGNHGHHGKH